MMDLARQYNMVPEEVFGKEGKTPEDVILQQVIIYNIARQTK